ncbi:hypothetical protein BGZ61DRAFT_515897 [Ilyonectria robusta]|uniref:uncharacterized protein n=1 Tax=Ilyonectria robusta TaxID=1079257 RepID=UPI001E8D829F|nr:uncharacterized protein BGZ61DRAFT_515897 [Ilyonectria robusta]KAH8729991.1 hypothetical protein BGZ61DRAFT_515897 [Ilyonectria robusta]
MCIVCVQEHDVMSERIANRTVSDSRAQDHVVSSGFDDTQFPSPKASLDGRHVLRRARRAVSQFFHRSPGTAREESQADFYPDEVFLPYRRLPLEPLGTRSSGRAAPTLHRAASQPALKDNGRSAGYRVGPAEDVIYSAAPFRDASPHPALNDNRRYRVGLAGDSIYSAAPFRDASPQPALQDNGRSAGYRAGLPNDGIYPATPFRDISPPPPEAIFRADRPRAYYF